VEKGSFEGRVLIKQKEFGLSLSSRVCADRCDASGSKWTNVGSGAGSGLGLAKCGLIKRLRWERYTEYPFTMYSTPYAVHTPYGVLRSINSIERHIHPLCSGLTPIRETRWLQNNGLRLIQNRWRKHRSTVLVTSPYAKPFNVLRSPLRRNDSVPIEFALDSPCSTGRTKHHHLPPPRS
jgi:hypothetical protein